ncbi:MAG: hypothetical protein ACLFUI_07085 [Halanaerobiales bacterium]
MLKNIAIKVISNGFCLLVPIFLFNMIFANKLPAPFSTDKFDQGIPDYILMSENILRVIVFILPVFMKIGLTNNIQKIGLLIYLIGILLYFASWFILIYYPGSRWSTGLIGFMAPAYTPLIWLIGIGMICYNSNIINIYRPWMYFVFSILFTGIHSYHTYLAYLHFNYK